MPGVCPPYFYRQDVSPNLKFTDVARPTGQKEPSSCPPLALRLKVDRVGASSWVLGACIFKNSLSNTVTYTRHQIFLAFII